MIVVKSLWASVEGDPVFMRRVNGWLNIFWIIIIPVSLPTGWVSSGSTCRRCRGGHSCRDIGRPGRPRVEVDRAAETRTYRRDQLSGVVTGFPKKVWRRNRCGQLGPSRCPRGGDRRRQAAGGPAGSGAVDPPQPTTRPRDSRGYSWSWSSGDQRYVESMMVGRPARQLCQSTAAFQMAGFRASWSTAPRTSRPWKRKMTAWSHTNTSWWRRPAISPG